LLQIHDYLNAKLKSQGLPHLDYRISADYGLVAVAKTPLLAEDIFGQPVNVCAKINPMAQSNTLVIGSDYYEAAKGLECYQFKEVREFSSGLKQTYPVYSVLHNDSNKNSCCQMC
jgi:class 3 adenylate cyclase